MSMAKQDTQQREEREEREPSQQQNGGTLPPPQPNPAHASVIRRSYDDAGSEDSLRKNNGG